MIEHIAQNDQPLAFALFKQLKHALGRGERSMDIRGKHQLHIRFSLNKNNPYGVTNAHSVSNGHSVTMAIIARQHTTHCLPTFNLIGSLIAAFNVALPPITPAIGTPKRVATGNAHNPQYVLVPDRLPSLND